MQKALKEAFPIIDKNSCLYSCMDMEFGIYDCPKDKKCKIQSDPKGIIQFTVQNPNLNEISILLIDGCMFSSNDETRCDFAVFDKKVFCFVELKMPESSRGVHANRNKAKKQLINTIKLLKSKVKFSTKRIEAYLCLGDTPPRPAQTAQLLDEIVTFADIGATLYHGNSKKFK